MNRKNKICIVTNLSLRNEPTVKNRLEPYVSEYLNRGSEVTLVSSDIESIERFKENERFTHKRVTTKKIRPKSFISRALFEYKEAKKLLRSLRRYEFDIYIITIPSMFLLFNINQLKGRRIVLDVRDITWEYLSDKKITSFLAKKLFRLLAKISFNNLSCAVVTNKTERDYFEREGVKVFSYTNGVSLQQFKDLNSLKVKRAGETVVTYIGKVGVAQNLSIFVEAAKKLPNINFRIVGYGPEVTRIENLITRYKIRNIELTGTLDWQGVLSCYEDSDILYAQLIKDFSGAMPSKLYQYLCAKRFIIYGGEKQAASILSKFDHNTLIEPDNVEDLEMAIVEYQSLKSKAQDYDNNVNNIYKNYIRENNVSRLINALDA
jgi:glycosyltransferase involved in cell wall biosynthesis